MSQSVVWAQTDCFIGGVSQTGNKWCLFLQSLPDVLFFDAKLADFCRLRGYWVNPIMVQPIFCGSEPRCAVYFVPLFAAAIMGSAAKRAVPHAADVGPVQHGSPGARSRRCALHGIGICVRPQGAVQLQVGLAARGIHPAVWAAPDIHRLIAHMLEELSAENATSVGKKLWPRKL